MELLDVPDHVFNWLVDYFDNRGHATRLGDVISLVAGINASIIQRSVIGPPSYVIVASDLHPKHQRNLMTKYADDTYLLIVSNNIGTAAEEIWKHSVLSGEEQSSHQLEQNQGVDYLPATLQIGYL